jgi:pimeloyl-ACP methyl ester carboxylesterase
MSTEPDGWSRAYRPLRPRSLAVQLVLLVVAEVGLYVSYDAHDARFHWATHFLVALAFASLVLLVRLLVTGVPGPRLLLPSVLGFHLFAMAPDLLFRGGVPHYRWMDVFLGHVAAHYLPGGDGTWLVVALICLGLFVGALTAWLRARQAEADAGMPPGIGLTGMAVLRPQDDPRRATLVHDENGSPDDGPTVVLLHGLGASSAFWRPVAAELSGTARTVVPDLLGFGASIRLGTHFHLDDQAAAVVRLVERHGGAPVVLAAHSYGAAVAVTVARDRPDLVRRLVLVNPAAFADAAEARDRIGGRSWIARKTMSGSPVADVACGRMCLLRRPLTSLAPRVAARVSPDIPSDVARDAVRYVWPAYRDALTSLLQDSPLPAWLADPLLPTTVVIAEDDQTVPAAGLGALLGPGVEAVRLPGTHGLPMERPADVARAVLSGRNSRASTAL